MKKIKGLVAVLAFLTTATTASALDTTLPEYGRGTVGQGYKYVMTKEGKAMFCVHLDHDRNGDAGYYGNGFEGIDVIEYKVIKQTDEGIGLEKHPYIVIVDDDFDGWADREFIDNGKVRDGIFDEVNDLKDEKINMNSFNYNRYSL